MRKGRKHTIKTHPRFDEIKNKIISEAVVYREIAEEYRVPWMVKCLLVRMLAGKGYSGPAGEGEAWNDRGHLTSR